MQTPSPNPNRPIHPLPRLIFMARWLQLPLYLGLIVAQAIYVWYFWVELVHLVEAAMGSQAATGQDPDQRDADRHHRRAVGARDRSSCWSCWA